VLSNGTEDYPFTPLTVSTFPVLNENGKHLQSSPTDS